VDELAREVGGPLAVDAARVVIERAREEIRAGADPGDLGARLREELADARRPRLRKVINATGIVIHTNLGRAPLAGLAITRIQEVADGYSNLEYDLTTGERGSRQDHVAAVLRRLTGAEAALVVNNNAAAVLLALAALAEGREVVVSRGELIEIGDGFRIPDVLARSGARLVEVGTTNRTRAEDYENAITSETALLLRVHQANFRVVGFEETPRLEEVAEVARRHGLPLVDDLGSGAITPVFEEPTAKEMLAAGADLICFSGDKLLGGPQAGIVVGRAELIEKLRRHPLHRAVRIDKLSLAALEGTLLLHLDAPEKIPVLQMLARNVERLRQDAEWLALMTDGEVVETVGRVGGGALPLAEIPSFACAVDESLAEPLRLGEPAVVGVVRDGRLLLDCLTIWNREEQWEVAALVNGARIQGWDRQIVDLITDIDGMSPAWELRSLVQRHGAAHVTRVIRDGAATVVHMETRESQFDLEPVPAEEAVRLAQLEPVPYEYRVVAKALEFQSGSLLFRYAADDPAAIAEVRSRAGLE
jgi:L-seryl-tRNA(Ser) seleniumtransferase